MYLNDEIFSKRFNKIESKNMTKILQNEYKYTKWILVTTMLLLVVIITMAIIELITKNSIFLYIYLFVTIFFIINMLFFVNRIENRKFMKIVAQDRQFYILYLLRMNMKKDYYNNRFKIWSLIRAYLKELYLCQLEFIRQQIFEVDPLERDLNLLSESLTKKIYGLVLQGEKKEEILDVVNILLNINQIRNYEVFIDINNEEFHEQLATYKMELFDKLYKLPEDDTKIDILGIIKYMDFFRNINTDILIVIITTFLVLGFYIILSNFKNEEFSSGMFISLILTTPTCVAVFINAIKKSNKL